MENLDDPFAKQITISLCKKIICSFLTDSPITLLEILILGKTHMIRCRSISTVEGSGATCTRIFFEFFFKTGDLSMVQLTQKIQKISNK